jgi:outer membrane protein OmpA-like peptidoglycan-associated protein
MAEGEGRAIWPWLILAALLALLLFGGIRMCSTPRVALPVAEAPAPEPATPVEPTVAEHAPAEIALPSGTVLTVPPGSVGENLFKFLTGAETGSKTFLFDGLTFDPGKATLDERSQATIGAIAGILKEFGAVSVSVDGYTDNTGATAANQRLSEARARTVLEALAAAGVDAGRITAVGHGDENPVADNATDEGRSQNRRTELTATKN